MKARIWNYYIAVFTGLLLLSACYDEKLENALLLSGENKEELEKVLMHYKGDDLKYAAASFLIRNMPGHARYDSFAVKRLQPYYDKCREISIKYNWEWTVEWRDETNAYWEKVKPGAFSSLGNMKMDVYTLKSE